MEIEKNVPLPTNNSDIFKQMEVGDSLLIEGGFHGSKIVNRGRRYFERSGKKVVLRTEEAGVRFWRTA